MMERFQQTASPQSCDAVTAHMQEWHGCAKCDRHVFCNAYCFYRGHVPAPICFIGEAPGESENTFGLPFVGAAGEKLNEIIYAIVPPWIDYAITNVLACVPYDDNGDIRNPTFTERMNCQPRLHDFVKICNPRLIVGVGNYGRDAAINIIANVLPSARMCTFKHPSWILRQEDRVLETQRAILELKEGLLNVRILRPNP